MFSFLNQHLAFILPILYKIALAGGLLFGAHLVSKLCVVSLEKGLHKIKNVDDTFLPVTKLIMQYLVYGIAGLFILNLFGVNTASIVTLVGVGGLSIGLALKDILSNVASGLALLMLRPFRNGDAVEAGGVSGVIKEIGLFTTRLQTFSGVYVCVPNNLFWTNSILNYSRNKKRRFEIQVPLTYFDSLDSAMTALNEVLSSEPRLLDDPAPQLFVKKLNFTAVVLEMRAWVKTAEYWDVYWSVNQKVKAVMEQGKMAVPLLRKEIQIQKDAD